MTVTRSWLRQAFAQKLHAIVGRNVVGLADVAVDGALQVGDRADHAVLQPAPGERREDALERVQTTTSA